MTMTQSLIPWWDLMYADQHAAGFTPFKLWRGELCSPTFERYIDIFEGNTIALDLIVPILAWPLKGPS